jgi:hypothetical protein
LQNGTSWLLAIINETNVLPLLATNVEHGGPEQEAEMVQTFKIFHSFG